MKATLHAVFANRTDADGAAQALLNAGFRPAPPTSISDSPVGPVATLDSNMEDRLLTGLGLGGAAFGCIFGLLMIPNFAARASMYLVIVPLSFTMWGLALGLFAAMGLARFKYLTSHRPSVNLASIRSSDVCVSVVTTGTDEVTCVENIVSEFRSTNLSYEFNAADEVEAPAPVTLLALKSA